MPRILWMSSLLAVVVVAGVALAQAAKPSTPPGQAAAPHSTVVMPDQLQWGPGFLPGTEMAVLEGDLRQKGIFTVRMKFPDGYRLPPHSHPHVERITMLSGTWMSAQGTRWDESALKPLPAGTFMLTRPGGKHYGVAKGEVIMQITSEGPYDLVFIDPKDDPRRAKAQPAR